MGINYFKLYYLCYVILTPKHAHCVIGPSANKEMRRLLIICIARVSEWGGGTPTAFTDRQNNVVTEFFANSCTVS